MVMSRGSSVGDITETSLKDRRILGEEGFVSVIVVIDSVTGKVVSGPEIHARGFAEDDDTFAEIVGPIVDALNKAVADGVDEQDSANDRLAAPQGAPPETRRQKRPGLAQSTWESRPKRPGLPQSKQETRSLLTSRPGLFCLCRHRR